MPKTSLVESLRQHIYLILTTHLGAYRFDPEYGCVVWEHDFELLYTLSSWQNRVADSIKHSLLNQELRLTEVQVKVGIQDREWHNTRKNAQLLQARTKKCINVAVSGRLKATNELVDFPDFTIFFSPVSLD